MENNMALQEKYGWEYPYLSTMRDCLETGNKRKTENGATFAKFAGQMHFNLQEVFPLLTTKALDFELIVAELLCFLEGGNKPNEERGEIRYRMSLKRLEEISGKPATQNWVDAAENFKKHHQHSLDQYLFQPYQLADLLAKLKSDYVGSYPKVIAWDPSKLSEAGLYSCQDDFQCFVRKNEAGKRYLSLQANLGACDLYNQTPKSIARYAILTHILAHLSHMEVDELVISMNDYYLYESDKGAIEEQLGRNVVKLLPRLWLNSIIKNLDDFTMESFRVFSYQPLSERSLNPGKSVWQ